MSKRTKLNSVELDSRDVEDLKKMNIYDRMHKIRQINHNKRQSENSYLFEE